MNIVRIGMVGIALIALAGCETLKLPDKGVGCSKLVRPWGSLIVTVATGDVKDQSQPSVQVDDNCKMTVISPGVAVVPKASTNLER